MTDSLEDVPKADWPCFVLTRARYGVAVMSGIFVLFGLVAIAGAGSTTERSLGLVILFSSLILAIRSLFAFEIRLTPHEVILKSLYWTRRVPYPSIQQAKRSVGMVRLYQRAYIELDRTDGSSIRFTAFNQSPSSTGEVERAVESINRQLAVTR